jgi:hypothetical protein
MHGYYQCWPVIDFSQYQAGWLSVNFKFWFSNRVSIFFLKSDFWDLYGINIKQGSVNQVMNIIFFCKGKNHLVCIRVGYNLFENWPMQCLGRLLSWKNYTFYLQSDTWCLHKKRNAKSTSKLAYWIRAPNRKTSYSSPLLLHGSNALLKTWAHNSNLSSKFKTHNYSIIATIQSTTCSKKLDWQVGLLSLFTPNSELSFS